MESRLNENPEENLNEIQRESQRNSATESQEDNMVEFYSNKRIESDDLQVLLLFLENYKACGGGDTINAQLDCNKRLLTLTYENNSAKKRVLEKKLLDILAFKLIASEPFNVSKLKHEDKTIIMRNVSPKTDKTLIQLYAENLIQPDNSENDVVDITVSNFFANTCYVRFKLAYDYDQLIKRLSRRPQLAKEKIVLLQAHCTNSILVKMYGENGEALSRELVELYFSNLKRCGADSYLSIRERHPFWLITYTNQQLVDKIVGKRHVVDSQEFLVEKFLSFEMLDEAVKRFDELRQSEKEKPPTKTNTTTTTTKKVILRLDLKRFYFMNLIGSLLLKYF